jgi:hypothetical protein
VLIHLLIGWVKHHSMTNTVLATISSLPSSQLVKDTTTSTTSSLWTIAMPSSGINMTLRSGSSGLARSLVLQAISRYVYCKSARMIDSRRSVSRSLTMRSAKVSLPCNLSVSARPRRPWHGLLITVTCPSFPGRAVRIFQRVLYIFSNISCRP